MKLGDVARMRPTGQKVIWGLEYTGLWYTCLMFNTGNTATIAQFFGTPDLQSVAP